MAEYVSYGYGVDVSEIQVDDIGKLKKLIAHAPKYEAKAKGLINFIESTDSDIDDYLDDLSSYTNRFGYGIASILAEVIEEAEGVSFLACDNDTGACYLLFEPDFPWNFKNKKQQDFTPDMIGHILKKYISILSDKQIVCDYMSVVNFD